MKKRGGISFVIFLFLFVILASAFVMAENATIDSDIYSQLQNNSEANVIIKLNESSAVEQVKEEILNNNSREYGTLISASVSAEDVAKLKENANVEAVFVAPRIKAFLQDSVPLINATEVWPIQISGINITGVGGTICVIDSGINFSHPDLLGKNKTCTIDCFDKTCVENCSVSDDNGHGTHVAGIIAASGGIFGVAPGANLIGLKILDENGEGSVNAGIDLTNAIDWCVANRNLYNISVISMSLGTSNYLNNTYCDGDFTDSWTRAINNATYYNISVIAATGNSGNGILRNTTSIAAPACIQNVTSVSATDKDDEIASYAHYSNFTSLFAPGTNINSTWNDGGYQTESGTSMATPHVAGAFALIRQLYRLQNNIIATPLQIRELLNSTGKIIGDGSTNFSRIDVYAAVDSILQIVNVNLNSPSNNSFINEEKQNQSFNCSATSINRDLTNVTFYVWNSSSLEYNETKDTSGTSGQFIFNYNFSNEDRYYWNCIASDEDGIRSSNENDTFTYDTTSPSINLVYPSDRATWTSSSTVSFSYNVSDVSIANCSLMINNVGAQTSSSVAINTTKTFTKSLANGNYLWRINCTDSAGNINGSEQRSLTVSYIQGSGGGGSSGGGAPALGTTYRLTSNLTNSAEGSTRNVKKYDRIKFYVQTNGKEEEHSLVVQSISNNSASLTIFSNPINASLNIGETKKFDLDGDYYYDLMLKLVSIKNGGANFTINTIHEKIVDQKIVAFDNGTKNNIPEEKPSGSEMGQQKNMDFTRIIISTSLILIIFGFIFSYLHGREKERKKQDAMLELKERFNRHVAPRKV